ncbi:MAG: hypothetical protein M1816_006834 [Peltula sp. TS41687]|nr:MAG: hypothetical protein M1816_006834 [Peltula sp. TS41687]
MTVDEESPLLANQLSASDQPAAASNGVGKGNGPLFGKTSIAAALLGVFLCHADDTLVLTTHETIASQFQDLSSGPWPLTGYTLGYCVALPVESALHTPVDKQWAPFRTSVALRSLVSLDSMEG